MLVTTVANKRPELFASVLANVPVTDMLRFNQFTTGQSWCSEYGCADQGDGEYLIKYSPYHNVGVQKYPAMFIHTGDHDDRVVPSHAYKYVAAL